jgi:hypothetical protein
VGSHSITASYSGNTNNAGSTSNTLSHVVDQATSTIELGSSANPSTFGQSVTFTATVAGQNPTGTVTFNDGAITLCSAVALSSGAASCASNTLSVAVHSVTATYGGDTNNIGSTSTMLSQAVDQAVSSTALVSSANPSTYGQSVTFTVTVTGESPQGTVDFKDGGTTVCGAVALSAGQATCATSALSAATHSMTAVYNGDTGNAASTSPALSQTVNRLTTTTLLSTDCETTFVENQPFTLNALISGASPAGVVDFRNGATVLCANVAASSGNASCTVSDLATIGSDTQDSYGLTAHYSGDTNNMPSASMPLVVTVLSAADVVFRNGFETASLACPIE